MSENISRLLRSPKTIRARLTYDPPVAQPNVTIRSSHTFLTDRFNPIPVSSYTRAIEPTSVLSPRSKNADTSHSEISQAPAIAANICNEPPAIVVTTNPTEAEEQTLESNAASGQPSQTGVVDDLMCTFEQRKEEREKCSKEFTEFLNNSLIPSSASVKIASIAPMNNAHASPSNSRPTMSIVAPVELHAIENAVQPKPADVKVKSICAELKLSPRAKPPSSKKPPLQTKPPQPASNARRSQNPPNSIPNLKIGSSKASSINMDTDRQPPSLMTDRGAAMATNNNEAADRTRSAFDSARARKFMAEQQKKRKLANKTVTVQEKCSAEERKRRLAELQLHTRSIVKRNVQKHVQQKGASKGARNDHEENVLKTVRDDVKDTAPMVESAQRPYIDANMQNRRKPDRGAIHFAFPPPAVETTRTTIDDQGATNVTTITTNNSDPNNSNSLSASGGKNRRIGILRRTSEPSAENARIPSPMNIHFNQLIAPGLKMPLPSASTLSDTICSGSPRPTTSHQLLDYSQLHAQGLQMPDVKLKTPASVSRSVRSLANGSKLTLDATPATSKPACKSDDTPAVNVPNWLRPSPLQVYPYNFIMAVRKKLELIANPMLSDRPGKVAAPKSPQSRPTYFKRKSIGSGGVRKKIQRSNQHKTVKHTDILSESDAFTNLSSMSVHLPSSKAQSKDANRSQNQLPKTPFVNNVQKPCSDSDSQATLTISSTIFSQSSPEKKNAGAVVASMPPPTLLAEPLSTDAIVDLRVVSRATKATTTSPSIATNIPTNAHPFLNFSRGCAAVPSSRTHHSRKTASSSDTTSAVTTTLDKSNIIDMLDSFNRSLSHAISVNQKLHETLNRKADEPNAVPAVPAPSTSAKSARDEYSSKFDSATSSNPSTAKSSKASTSQLDNESIVQSTGMTPTTATSRSVQSESVQTELSQKTEPASEASGRTSSGQSTLIETNQSLQSAKPNSLSSIRTQLASDDDANATISSVARNFEHAGYMAEPSARSVDAFNWTPHCETTPITARPTDTTTMSSTKHTVRSSTSSTVTIKSMKTSKLPEPLNYDANKENVYLNANATQTSKGISDQVDLNQSIGSDIFAVFNQTDIEYTVMQPGSNRALSTSTTTVVSESNISYSALGMYDQLLKTEDQKSIDLTALLKAREKALMDRTKGQIAWLELQKQKFQERGLTAQISAVKKKQRALLVHLERERTELAKSAKQNVAVARPKHATVMKLSQLQAPAMRRSMSPAPSTRHQNTPKPAMRAIDFAADTQLEEMLQQRENALRQRRSHVESLIRWHQRLDEEENAVAQMECQLMARKNQMNNQRQQMSLPASDPDRSHSTTSRHARSPNRHQRQIQKIEHSLDILHALPDRRGVAAGQTTDAAAAAVSASEERVSVSGSKMNRLWRRLTGESGCKFIPDRRYDLSKADIAGIYEEAKRLVLAQFEQTGGGDRAVPPILDQTQLSAASTSAATSVLSSSSRRRRNVTGDQPMPVAADTNIHHSITCDEFIVVPALNLNFTSTEEQSVSGASDAEAADGNSMPTGYYFTDNVQSLRSSDDKKGHNDWDGDGDQASLNGSAPSQDDRTFRMQPVASNNPLRDSVFSVDSLNSSHPEVSEAVSIGSASGSAKHATTEPSLMVEAIAETSLTPQSATATEEPTEAEQTQYIGDTTCPTLMENSAALAEIFEQSSLQATTSTSTSTIVTADNNGSTATSVIHTDNDHLLSPPPPSQSYSDSFEPAASTITSHNSDDDKITKTEPIAINNSVPPAMQPSEGGGGGGDGESMASNSVGASVESENAVSSGSEIVERISSKSHSVSSVEETSITAELSVITSDNGNKENLPVTSNGDDDSDAPTQSGPKSDVEVAVMHVSAVANVPQAVTAAQNPTEASTTYEMPDIISEAEVLRRQQMRIEEEIKQLEQSAAAPFAYIREIPNKPPPPYVPPAHGSPMTAIFPSDARIRDIVYRRVEQLLGRPSPSTPIDSADGEELRCATATTSSDSDENITNIYERIALDICGECIQQCMPEAQWLKAVVSVADEAPQHDVPPPPRPHHRGPVTAAGGWPLAFYNPPDRLRCMQQHVLRRVKKLLSGGSSNAGATHGPAAELNHHTSATVAGGSAMGGAKRKMWWNDVLLHEEMIQDDATWTNYDAERTEVLRTVSNEIVRILVAEALTDCEKAFERKAQWRKVA